LTTSAVLNLTSSGSHIAPAYQIATKSGNVRIFSAGFWGPYDPQFLDEWTKLPIRAGHRTVILPP